ncbi:MAG: ABC transporter permease [Christensenellales bacterium]
MDILTSFLAATISSGTPLLYATLGEILTEKAGNLNLGVEGMMLLGAAFSFITGMAFGSPLLALLAGMAAGGIGALIYAFLTVTLRANQVVTGLSLTIFGTGLANFIGNSVTGLTLSNQVTGVYQRFAIPLLSKIPVIGQAFFIQSIFVYIGYIAAIVMWIYLNKTTAGLRVRTVGENPGAADTAGIAVNGNKYIHICIGGVLSGIAGAYLSLNYSTTWQPGITGGMGWIAVALVIFSVWNPLRALFGAYIFGALRIVGFQLQSLKINIPIQIVDMLPYAFTIIVLIMVSARKSRKNPPPGSLSIPYFREER